jgi:hypothetical protein
VRLYLGARVISPYKIKRPHNARGCNQTHL